MIERMEPVEVDPLRECPDCGSTDGSRIDLKEQTFQYGPDSEKVVLTCEVRVHRCNRCGCEWTGADAEDARQVAVCHHLRRLGHTWPRATVGLCTARRCGSADYRLPLRTGAGDTDVDHGGHWPRGSGGHPD